MKPTINVPFRKNKLLEQALKEINSNEEILTLWNILNVNAIDRLKMTDHGPVHFQLVANISLKLLRMLIKSGVKPSVVKDFKLTNDHAELIVLLASLLHDTGMSINREEHEEFSLFIANNLMRESLGFLPIKDKTIVISETLHAIINHRSGGRPATIEGGVLRVGDALDMSEGRSRIPFDAGQISIHSVSALAIDEIKITEGKNTPILIEIIMNNSAGIYQIDQLLRRKLTDSGIEKYIEVRALIKSKAEKNLIKNFTFK